jgi:hypothetical protein
VSCSACLGRGEERSSALLSNEHAICATMDAGQRRVGDGSQQVSSLGEGDPMTLLVLSPLSPLTPSPLPSIWNSSVVTANPTSTSVANPQTRVQAVSNAVSEVRGAREKERGQNCCCFCLLHLSPVSRLDALICSHVHSHMHSHISCRRSRSAPFALAPSGRQAFWACGCLRAGFPAAAALEARTTEHRSEDGAGERPRRDGERSLASHAKHSGCLVHHATPSSLYPLKHLPHPFPSTPGVAPARSDLQSGCWT